MWVKLNRALECFYVADVQGKPVSTLAILDHNLSAETFAQCLREAAKWFQKQAKK